MTRIVLGVTGSIAAYKALEIVRRLKERDAQVSVIMTKAAQELIRPLSFESLSGNRVYTDMFSTERPANSGAWKMEHIDLALTADLLLVAPASANVIGKIASGVADDLLTTVIMATKAPVLIAPAMNDQMWANPIVQANVARLKSIGYRFVEPESGSLACGAVGPGRLASVETICQAAFEQIPNPKSQIQNPSLAGKTVIVTSGRSEEAIDPVRVLTNRSSGKMGFALAQAARAAGARVILVAGKTSVPSPAGLEVMPVTTTEEMLQALRKLLPQADVLLMAAAPADFRPHVRSGHKRKDAVLTLELERTPDILSELAERGTRNAECGMRRPLLIGFSLESENLVSNARAKLRRKGLDLIVANSVETLDGDEIQATLIFRNGRSRRLPRMSKAEFAVKLVVETARLLKAVNRK